MMSHAPRSRRLWHTVAALAAAALLASCQREPTSPSHRAPDAGPPAAGVSAAPLGRQPDLTAAIRAKDAHAAALLSRADIAGVGVGRSADGRPAVVVFQSTRASRGLPATLDGIPVRAVVTGPFLAIGPAQDAPAFQSRAGARLRTTSRWPEPVPIGVSTGNAGECSAGTISARVSGKGKVFALSNNHVYALENDAATGSEVLQPGLYDTKCRYSASNHLGYLADFVTIDFSGDPTNTVDAAIAETTTDLLGNATPPDGYGEPSATTGTATLDMLVQKYGRTSRLTHGQVTAIDATIDIGYSSGTARFIHQVVVQSGRPFLKPGDSGSLLVTDDASATPVGLLFAANQSGGFAIANRIGDVLAAFGVSIDGK